MVSMFKRINKEVYIGFLAIILNMWSLKLVMLFKQCFVRTLRSCVFLLQLDKGRTKFASLLRSKKEIPRYKQKPPIKRLRITSRSYSEPWGLHPVGALRSAPTGRPSKQNTSY